MAGSQVSLRCVAHGWCYRLRRTSHWTSAWLIFLAPHLFNPAALLIVHTFAQSPCPFSLVWSMHPLSHMNYRCRHRCLGYRCCREGQQTSSFCHFPLTGDIKGGLTFIIELNWRAVFPPSLTFWHQCGRLGGLFDDELLDMFLFCLNPGRSRGESLCFSCLFVHLFCLGPLRWDQLARGGRCSTRWLSGAHHPAPQAEPYGTHGNR